MWSLAVNLSVVLEISKLDKQEGGEGRDVGKKEDKKASYQEDNKEVNEEGNKKGFFVCVV